MRVNAAELAKQRTQATRLRASSQSNASLACFGNVLRRCALCVLLANHVVIDRQHLCMIANQIAVWKKASTPTTISTHAKTASPAPAVQWREKSTALYFRLSSVRDDLKIGVCSNISLCELAVFGSTDDKLRGPRVVVDARWAWSVKLIDADAGAEVAEIENTTAAVLRGAQGRRKIAVGKKGRRQRG